jgi:hypothetical protein
VGGDWGKIATFEFMMHSVFPLTVFVFGTNPFLAICNYWSVLFSRGQFLAYRELSAILDAQLFPTFMRPNS